MNKAMTSNQAGILCGSAQIAAYIGRSHPTALRLIQDEGLPAAWIRGNWWTTKKAIDHWLASRLPKPKRCRTASHAPVDAGTTD
jgi:hypothetical protein